MIAIVGAMGIVSASSASAVPKPDAVSGSFSGPTSTFNDSCGFHTVVSFPVTGQLSPGPKFTGILNLDYCTPGTQPLAGTWQLLTKQGNGTLSGSFGNWTRTAPCGLPTVGCTEDLIAQMFPTGGTGVFTRFHSGLLSLTQHLTTVSGSFPSAWTSSAEGTFDGTLTH
jgi:hypothetical protein